jgi:hypothetical protein
MSLFSFKKNKFSVLTKDDYSLIISIGSGQIFGAIVKFTEKSGENVVYFTKEKISFQANIDPSRHLSLMFNTLSVLISRIQKEGLIYLQNTKNKIKFEKIFCLLSSPWCNSEIKNIHIKENKPFKFTQLYLDNVISECEKDHKHNSFQAVTVIEKQILQIKNNGYIIQNIVDQMTKDLDLSLYVTTIDNKTLESIKIAILKTFNIKDVWCHSSLLAIFSNIRNLFSNKEDFVHIDVSDEITDISIIKDNSISEIASIPFGRNYFVRELSKNMNCSEAIANSIINMQKDKDPKDLNNLKNAVELNNLLDVWFEEVNKILIQLKTKIYISNDVFLIADKDLTFILKNKIQKSEYNVLLVNNPKIKSHPTIDDQIFRLELMFLDNLYKI